VIREVKAIIRPDRLDDVLDGLRQIADLPGVTVSVVRGVGRSHPDPESHRGDAAPAEFAKLETVVPSHLVTEVTAVIRRLAHTGRPSDGKIFVIPVDAVIRISSGEEGEQAI